MDTGNANTGSDSGVTRTLKAGRTAKIAGETSALKKKKRAKLKREIRAVAVFLAFSFPTILGLLVFKYGMAFNSVIYSFFRYSQNDLANPPGPFVWFENYERIFQSPIFWDQLKNTLILFVFGMAFGFFPPIVYTIFMSQIGRGQATLRYLRMLPGAIPGVAALAVWKYIYDSDFGILNTVVGFFDIPPQRWLEDPALVKFTLRFSGLLGGFNMLYLITINNIPEEIYEAARIDGASEFRCVFAITIPGMSTMIATQFLLSMSGALLAFQDVLVMTGQQGGPDGAASTLMMGVYNRMFTNIDYGSAMALAVIIVLLTCFFLLIRMYFARRLDDEGTGRRNKNRWKS
ncbi:MAG: sugar ABC transporter permease [Clostridiales bacterium]|jgi:multiple sugar transport system permease protein|nr:sugar ABC transporter permease [Clostridiales bacterium]